MTPTQRNRALGGGPAATAHRLFRSRIGVLISFCVLLTTSCSYTWDSEPLPTLAVFPTFSPSPRVVATAPKPASSPSATPLTEAATPLPTKPTQVPTATPAVHEAIRPNYHLAVDVDVRSHTAMVTATLSLTLPETQELVFNVSALQVPGVFHLLELQINAAPATAYADGVWLHVPLPGDFELNDRLTVQFAYRLALPPIGSEAWGSQGTLGWTPRQINLGDWYPVLAVYAPEQGWITHTPAGIGEYQTAVAADFEVVLQVQRSWAEPLVVGSGEAVACAARCYSLSGGRFVAYTISDQMQSQSITTATGVTVTSVYFPGHLEAGRAALAVAASALDRFSALFGPYPYRTFTVIEGDFYDGMEYSSLSFVGESYYVAFDESANNLLTAITAHETAHQWWHSLVGNDPALEPWLDEALCTYSELLYLEAAHPQVVPNWWNWRIKARQPAGSVNGSIYSFEGFRPYVNAVYLRGAQMLQTMRQAVGDEQFMAFLRQYAQSQAGHIAQGSDFWHAFEDQGGEPAVIQRLYFGAP